MNEYNEYPENKNSNNIKKDGDQSQDNPKTVTFDPVNDTEILEDSNLNDFKPNPQLNYENVNDFNPSMNCWTDKQIDDVKARIELEELVERIRNGETIMDGGDLVQKARDIVALEKLVEQIRNGDTILDGGDLVQRARDIVKMEELEEKIRRGDISHDETLQKSGNIANTEQSIEKTENIEGKYQEKVKSPTNSEKEPLKQVSNREKSGESSRGRDSESILEKIADVQTKVFVNKEHLGSVLKALKDKKQLSQQKISDKIGVYINSAYRRGESIPIENFEKLKNLANSVNINLKYERLIQKNVYDIKSMQKLASIVGNLKTGKPGKCLSETYQAMNKTLKWECGECGKVWEAYPNGIVYQQNWCTRCSGRETWSYDQMVALGKVRGLEKTGVEGKFLTTVESYENQKFPDRSKYNWKCGKCETEFEASANNVKRGSWCRVCQYDKLSKEFREPYENIQKLAKKIGTIKTGYSGEFLADRKYYDSVSMPSHHKFQWKCGKCESEFKMDITHVKRPQWCPTCTEGESERICRGYFERIFNAPFPKARPEWLINPETNISLELDGYNENLKIAFEFNGPQHYTYYPKFHKHFDDFKKQLEKDYIKQTICNEKGVALISVPHTLDYDEFQNFIKNKYEKMTGKDLGDIPEYDWRDFSTEQRRISDFFD